MKLYCKVEQGQVVEGPKLLPLHLSARSDFDLLNMGWYVVDRALPQHFDERLEVMTITYNIQDRTVVAIYNKRNKTEEEIQHYKNEITAQLQEKINHELKNCRSKLDFPEKLTLQEIESWQQYKNSLENFFNTDIPVWDIPFPVSPAQSLFPILN
jgi:hypothetical protein